MTFPAVASEASSTEDTNTTTHTVDMPAGVTAGDRLVLQFIVDGRPAVSGTIPDNWVAIPNGSTGSSGDQVGMRWYEKIATGSEGATQSITTDVSQCSAHHVWRITGAATTAAECQVTQGNSTANPDPPSNNPAGWDVEDTLWLVGIGVDDGTVTASAFPSGYTGTGQVSADGSADGVTAAWAYRTNAAASEDPGTFTLSTASFWCAATVAIRPVLDHPILQAEGTQPANVTTGNLTVGLPAHQADDILVAIVAIWAPNTAGSLAAIPALANWTKQAAVNFPATPDGEIAFFWRRATASGTTDPTFTRGASWDTGTDTAYGGRAFVIRGCITTGDPWDEFDPTAALTAANGSVDTVTVSGAHRTVIQFLGKTDDFVTAPTLSGWTAGTQTEQTAGTDTSFGTFRKENISSSTTADASTVEAVAQGAYVFFGVSFKPPDTGTSASAGNAAGLGDAGGVDAAVAPTAGSPTGAGSVSTAVARVAPSAGGLSGAAAALPASTAVAGSVGAGAGSGSAPTASAAVAVPAGLASGSGEALSATVSTAVATNANAGVAAADGTAGAPAGTVATGASPTTGAGTAPAALPSTSTAAGAATGAGHASQASVTAVSNVFAAAGAANATGAAHPAASSVGTAAAAAAGSGASPQPSLLIATVAGTGTGIGEALQPTVQTGSFTTADAGLASGAGSAAAPSVSAAPVAGLASATGLASAPTPSIGAHAGLGAATGSALGVTALAQNTALAGVASGAGVAEPARVLVGAGARVASGAGTAFGATVDAEAPFTDPNPTVGDVTDPAHGRLLEPSRRITDPTRPSVADGRFPRLRES